MHSSSTISTLDTDIKQCDFSSPIPCISHIEDKVHFLYENVGAENSIEGLYLLGIGISTKIALIKTQFIASIKLLLISAPRCHSHRVLEQSNNSPTRLFRYYTSRIGGHNMLKF